MLSGWTAAVVTDGTGLGQSGRPYRPKQQAPRAGGGRYRVSARDIAKLSGRLARRPEATL